MTKISQYTAITTLANGDLMDISQDVGGGLYQSKKITYQDLLTELQNSIGQNHLFGLYSQTSVSPTITNTTTESSIVGSGVGSLSVPPNTFQVGDSYHAKIGGVISTLNNHEITIRIKAGSIILASTGLIALEVSSSNGWECELDFTIASIGVAGDICTNGNFAYNRDTGSLEGFVFQDIQQIDTTTSQTLDISVEWNQANINDEIYSANFVLYKTY